MSSEKQKFEMSSLPQELPPPLMGGGEGAGDPEATLSLTLPHRGGGKYILLGMTTLCFLTFCLLSPASAIEPTPPKTQDIGIDSQVGQKISLNLSFKDEKGQTVALKDYFDGKIPVILNLVYYGCPDLCTLVVNHLTQTMTKSRWTAGNQFKIVTLSINPNETPELAAQKKESYLRDYNRPEAQNGWHFLTGLNADIKELSDQVGFHFQFIPETGEYAHSAGIFILSPQGELVRILHGNHYSTRDLKLALMEATKGHMGNMVDRVLFPFYSYDSTTRKYSLDWPPLKVRGGQGEL